MRAPAEARPSIRPGSTRNEKRASIMGGLELGIQTPLVVHEPSHRHKNHHEDGLKNVEFSETDVFSYQVYVNLSDVISEVTAGAEIADRFLLMRFSEFAPFIPWKRLLLWWQQQKFIPVSGHLYACV